MMKKLRYFCLLLLTIFGGDVAAADITAKMDSVRQEIKS